MLESGGGGRGHDIVAILADEEPASLKHQLCDQCRFFVVGRRRLHTTCQDVTLKGRIRSGGGAVTSCSAGPAASTHQKTSRASTANTTTRCSSPY